jgi:hypothetical protein
MKRATVIRGRIETHGEGLGTPNEELVLHRAREIAITNGRLPEQVNETDLQQARQELEMAENASPDAQEEENLVPREGPFGVSSGTAARKKLPTDEQTFPEDLVQEGVEEAAHERMMAGNEESRRRDKNFEDQLPEGAEEG